MCVLSQRLMMSSTLNPSSRQDQLIPLTKPWKQLPRALTHCLFSIDQWKGKTATSRFPSSWSSGRLDRNIWVLLSRYFPSFCCNILSWLSEERGTSLTFPFWDLIRKHEVGCGSLWEQVFISICIYAWRPDNNLGCHLLGTVHLAFCLSCAWNLASRLDWTASEHQVFTYTSLSGTGITSLYPYAWPLSVVSRTLTQVLMLAKQTLYWWSHLMGLAIFLKEYRYLSFTEEL